LNPMNARAMAPPTAPQQAGFTCGGTCMVTAFRLEGKRISSPLALPPPSPRHNVLPVARLVGHRARRKTKLRNAQTPMRSPGQHADAGSNDEGGNEPRRHGRTSRQAVSPPPADDERILPHAGAFVRRKFRYFGDSYKILLRLALVFDALRSYITCVV
jgi:hypothetical protein